MSASLTLGSCALAANGKTLTATISGGTGSGLSLGSSAGLRPVVTNPYQDFDWPIASASVAGTTLTIVLDLTVGTGETVKLNIPSSVTLTDSGGNTPTGQTNLAVTNNSTVTVRTLDPITDAASFEYNGYFTTVPFVIGARLGNETESFDVEFVTDATEVASFGYQGSASSVSVDGGAIATATFNPDGFWVAKKLASGLAAGKHLFLLSFGNYFYGIRLVGGTRSTFTVSTTKRTLLANTAGYADKPASTPVYLTGAWKVGLQGAAAGDVSTINYSGMGLEFAFTGTGVEVSMVTGLNVNWAASVDGGYEGALVLGGDSGLHGVVGMVPVVRGQASAAHTARLTLIGASSAYYTFLRIINGGVTTGSSAIGATSLTVNDATNIAVDDWIRIDSFGQREWRQVTAKVGTTLTVAALAKTHAAGVQVTSYSAPAGTISAWKSKDRPRKVAIQGDSNTQGANDTGFSGSPDANGVYYDILDPRWSPVFIGTRELDIDVLNFGVSGSTSSDQETYAADAAGAYKPAGGYDGASIETGTNDINGTSRTPTQYQASVQAMVNSLKPAMKTGAFITLRPPATPAGTTNAGGLSIATARAALAAIAAADPTHVLYDPDYTLTLVSGDLNGVHFHDAGITKRAQQAQRAITGGPKGFLAA